LYWRKNSLVPGSPEQKRRFFILIPVDCDSSVMPPSVMPPNVTNHDDKGIARGDEGPPIA
ncbi:MAG: hypothetical protein WBG62_06900, partial [Cyclobacteriaceae bacterium]